MKNIDALEFNSVIKNGKVIIVFYGTDCLNCKLMQQTFDKIEKAFPYINFYKVNAERSFSLIKRYQITSLPTLLIFRHGKMLSAVIGIKTTDHLKNIIDKLINYA